MREEKLVERRGKTDCADEEVRVQVTRLGDDYKVSIQSTKTISTVTATSNSTLAPAFTAALRAAILQGISFSSAVITTKRAYQAAGNVLFSDEPSYDCYKTS